MAVPKRKGSKQRQRKRRTFYKLDVPNLIRCPQCHTLKRSHRVCPECGFYNGKQVVAVGSDD